MTPLRLLLCLLDDDNAVSPAGDSAPKQENLVLLINTNYPEVLSRSPRSTHSAGHLRSLVNFRRTGGHTGGSRLTVKLRTMGLAPAAEVVALHYALVTLAKGGADDIDVACPLEETDAELLSYRVLRIEVANLRQMLLWFEPFLELAGEWLRRATFLHSEGSEYAGAISVAIHSSLGNDIVVFYKNDSYRRKDTAFVEDLCHAYLLAYQPYHLEHPIASVGVPLRLLLDLDVDARGQFESHKSVHDSGGRIEDVDQSLMRPHLKLLS